MGLKIYKNPDPATDLSQDNTFTNPFALAFDGTVGQIIEKRLYVRNSNNVKSYESITLEPVHLSDINILNEPGFSWKMIAGDEQPIQDQWNLVSTGNQILIPDIGDNISSDTNTYEPFWVRIEVPKGASVKTHQGVKLKISATEIDI